MCQEVRSQQFHVIRFDVIAPLDGCIGFAGAIERQGATWAGAELNIGMLARGANNGQQVTLDLRLPLHLAYHLLQGEDMCRAGDRLQAR